MIHKFDKLCSTNDTARDVAYVEGDVVCAEYQTAGRGQRGNKWSSGEGLNLMFTLVLEPTFLPVNRQFLLSEAVALGISDAMATFGVKTKIKWTNDIYVGDKKLAGILIEHNVSGANLARTIVGVGINVNQSQFEAWLPNPTSMKVVLERDLDRDVVLDAICSSIMERYEQLRRGQNALLESDYRNRLYKFAEKQLFALPSGERADGVICGVEPDGRLLIEWASGRIGGYAFKEVEFVIASRDEIF